MSQSGAFEPKGLAWITNGIAVPWRRWRIEWEDKRLGGNIVYVGKKIEKTPQHQVSSKFHEITQPSEISQGHPGSSERQGPTMAVRCCSLKG